jgi:hypothetical protein
MRRGDVVTVAASGDYGKLRPAVIVQTDALPGAHASVVICVHLLAAVAIGGCLFWTLDRRFNPLRRVRSFCEKPLQTSQRQQSPANVVVGPCRFRSKASRFGIEGIRPIAVPTSHENRSWRDRLHSAA